jgi:hypothetical protein
VFGNIESGEKLYHYDFTGMYAQVMLEKFGVGVCKKNNKINEIDKCGFYKVRVKSEGFEIPILSHKSKDNGKLLFTNGEFDGVYW